MDRLIKSNAKKTGFTATRGPKIHYVGTKSLYTLTLCKWSK